MTHRRTQSLAFVETLRRGSHGGETMRTRVRIAMIASVLVAVESALGVADATKPNSDKAEKGKEKAAMTAGSDAAKKKLLRRTPAEFETYRKVVTDTCAMVGDKTARGLAGKHGLQILNVTWEDTGRYKGSAVGPNISDMTLQVQLMDPRNESFRLYCMPVIRYPNFEDKSADIPLDKFYVLVGNEKGSSLRKVSLKELLGDLRRFMTKPESWKGREKSLLAGRDSRALVSAQACFLPIPKNGDATFNPVLFNYQSYEGDPAVLAILATREGTSMTVIDNKRDAFNAGQTWGQRLFFNQNGKRASLTGKRMSDYQAQQGVGNAAVGPDSAEAAGQHGLNMVLLVQVPLRQKNPMRFDVCEKTCDAVAPSAVRMPSDVEEAVIGHGDVEGPFTEIDGLQILRDPKFPIRVTVQFYKATGNGAVSEQDMTAVAEQIARVYKEADYVGSLVTQGETGRPTEHNGAKFEPPDWWTGFWQRHQTNTKMSPEETIHMLRELYGPNYTPKSEGELARELRRMNRAKSL